MTVVSSYPHASSLSSPLEGWSATPTGLPPPGLTVDPDHGERAASCVPAGTSSAATWAGLREMSAQSVGALAGLAVRSVVQTAPAVALATSGALALAGLGAATYRASDLIAAAVCRDRPQWYTPVRIAATALPLTAIAVGAGMTASASLLPAATGFVAGKLVQRCVRDLCSTTLRGVTPGMEAVSPNGMRVPEEDLATVDYGRGVATMLPTVGYFAAQELLVPAPEVSASLWEGLPYVAAVGLVEAARAATRTLAWVGVAQAEGHQVQVKAGGGWSALYDNLRSLSTLQKAGDAAAMRTYFSAIADTLQVVTTPSSAPLSPLIHAVLHAGLKAPDEFRGPLTTHGRLAMGRLASVVAPLDSGLKRDATGADAAVSISIQAGLTDGATAEPQ